MDVADTGMKEESGQPRKHRISDVPVKKWHRPSTDATSTRRQPASLHKVVSFTELFDKARDFEKVIAAIRIAHDHVFPSGSRDSSGNRMAIALGRHVENRGPQVRS
jgi:hypothetical protein